MATERDSPWDRVLLKASSLKLTSGGLGTGGSPAAQAILKNPTLGLKLVNGAGDMLDSLTKYVSDLLRYRTPVRYFLLSSYTNRRRLYYHHQQQREDDGGLVDFTVPRNISKVLPSSETPLQTTLFRSLFGQMITALLQKLFQ